MTWPFKRNAPKAISEIADDAAGRLFKVIGFRPGIDNPADFSLRLMKYIEEAEARLEHQHDTINSLRRTVRTYQAELEDCERRIKAGDVE